MDALTLLMATMIVRKTPGSASAEAVAAAEAAAASEAAAATHNYGISVSEDRITITSPVSE